MKRITLPALCAACIFVGGAASAQKIIGPDKPQLQPPGSILQVQPPGSLNAQLQSPGIRDALAKSGKFNTFLALVKAAGMDDWERAGNVDWDGDGKAGWADGSVHPVTVLAPNDAAFAKMDKAKLGALMND